MLLTPAGGCCASERGGPSEAGPSQNFTPRAPPFDERTPSAPPSAPAQDKPPSAAGAARPTLGGPERARTQSAHDARPIGACRDSQSALEQAVGGAGELPPPEPLAPGDAQQARSSP